MEYGDNGFAIYPNPTNGNFTIRSRGTGRFYLYTLLGQLVQSYPVTGLRTEMHMAQDMAPGVYMGRYEPADGSPETRVRIVYEKQ